MINTFSDFGVITTLFSEYIVQQKQEKNTLSIIYFTITKLQGLYYINNLMILYC